MGVSIKWGYPQIIIRILDWDFPWKTNQLFGATPHFRSHPPFFELDENWLFDEATRLGSQGITIFQESDLPCREYVSPPHNLFFWKKEKKSGETNPGSLAGTRRNQEIKMEQNPCPEGNKKIGRQAPEPKPEPEGTRKSWWKIIPFLRKERTKRKEKHGDKPRNPSLNHRNQEIMMEQNPFPETRSQEIMMKRKAGTSPGTLAGISRNQ